jgi:hypothetical protein
LDWLGVVQTHQRIWVRRERRGENGAFGGASSPNPDRERRTRQAAESLCRGGLIAAARRSVPPGRRNRKSVSRNALKWALKDLNLGPRDYESPEPLDASKTCAARRSGRRSTPAAPPAAPDLAQVTAAWAHLPEHLKAAILALVNSSKGAKQ